MKLQPIGWTTALIALGVCFLRGGNQVALKFGLTGFSPFEGAFLRMLVGAAAVGAWTLIQRAELRIRPDERRSLLQLTLLFLVQISLLHIGADYTSPAYAVILINSNPIFANFIAHFVVPEDRLSGPRVLGLGCAFVGVVFVLLGRPDLGIARDPMLGNITVLISGILVAARLVYTQRLVQRIEPTKLVFWQMVLALPGFAAAIWLMPAEPRGDVTWQALAGVAYQGAVVSGLTFMAWAILLQRHSPGSLSVFSFTVPTFGVLLSGWLFQEALTSRLLLGVLAVTGGIALATHAGRKAVCDAQPDGNEP
ncbi:MAG TPA: DMT family transporter [Bryobacterales bacterium]|nr:DMT family transporter [Bryobacterales bacterium]